MAKTRATNLDEKRRMRQRQARRAMISFLDAELAVWRAHVRAALDATVERRAVGRNDLQFHARKPCRRDRDD